MKIITTKETARDQRGRVARSGDTSTARVEDPHPAGMNRLSVQSWHVSWLLRRTILRSSRPEKVKSRDRIELPLSCFNNLAGTINRPHSSFGIGHDLLRTKTFDCVSCRYKKTGKSRSFCFKISICKFISLVWQFVDDDEKNGGGWKARGAFFRNGRLNTTDIFFYIEAFYNRKHRHSTLGFTNRAAYKKTQY